MCFDLCPPLLDTRTVQSAAEIISFMPGETLLAFGIFLPHINSPYFMLENKRRREKTSPFNNSNRSSPGEITKAGEYKEEMLICAQEQPRKPANEKTENKQIPPCPTHAPPPPPAANPSGLSVDLAQVPKLPTGSHLGSQGFLLTPGNQKTGNSLGQQPVPKYVPLEWFCFCH